LSALSDEKWREFYDGPDSDPRNWPGNKAEKPGRNKAEKCRLILKEKYRRDPEFQKRIFKLSGMTAEEWAKSAADNPELHEARVDELLFPPHDGELYLPQVDFFEVLEKVKVLAEEDSGGPTPSKHEN
jgi:hypothetical protein